MQQTKNEGFIKTMTMKMRETVENVETIPLAWLTGLIIIEIIVAMFINLNVFRNIDFTWFHRMTGGLINATLIVNTFMILFFIVICLLLVLKMSPEALGIRTNKIWFGLIRTFDVWLGLNIINIILMVIIDGKPYINQSFGQYGVLAVIGAFLGQLLGNALFEEVFFRGFLMAQMIAWVHLIRQVKYSEDQISSKSVWIGMAISQVIFALMHIPNRIYSGFSLGQALLSVIVLFIIGMLLAWLYLVSNNLFLVIGLHTLLNSPTLIFEGVTTYYFILIAILGFGISMVLKERKKLNETS